MLRCVGDLGANNDYDCSLLCRSVVFCICCSISVCFGLHLEAEPVCKTVAFAFSVKESTCKICLLIYELVTCVISF